LATAIVPEPIFESWHHEPVRVDLTNDLDQPVGDLVAGWTTRPRPTARPMLGRWCRLEPLSAHHADDLYRANRADEQGRMWTYLPYGPFVSLASYRVWLDEVAGRKDPMFFAIIDGQDRAVGVAALQRIDPAAGVIEVGHVAFSPALQGSTIATEAMALMMRTVFDDLGYRRYEWKCDSLNAPSRRAALRFGFVYEGTFRQAVVVKGRNRDTSWFSITDAEWPRLAAAYDRWLAPDNFDAEGRQRLALSSLTLPDASPAE
jgi:RimJ/RimL family protein N-acetyltransferase